MNYLDNYLTPSDENINTSIQGNKPTDYKAPIVKDIAQGTWYGAKVGTFSLINAGHRMWIGDEEADQIMNFIDQENRPKTLGTAGEISAGIGKVVTPAVIGSVATLGTGTIPSIAVSSGTTGLATYSQKHAELTQKHKVDDETADFASFLYASTNAALVGVPMAGVSKNILKDVAITVGGTTAVAQASMYAEGTYLESKGYTKIGQHTKEMATDPTMILTNLAIGGVMWGGTRYIQSRNNLDLNQQQVDSAADAFDQAVIDATRQADIESNPVNVTDAGQDIQHQVNLDQAIQQIMKGEKVNISEATNGQLKTMTDVRSYLQGNDVLPTQTPKTNRTLHSQAEVVQNNTNKLVKDSYQLAQEAGFTPSQAKALVGELGRENSYNPNIMFGSHNDPARGYNLGIFSWQGTRRKELVNFLTQRGLMNADGTIKRTNEALKAQFEFLKLEIVNNSKWKANFLDKPNLTNAEARTALGGKGSIIGWARGQTTIRKDDGSRVPFDWQSHENRANNFSKMVDDEPEVVADNTANNTVINEAVEQVSNSTAARTDSIFEEPKDVDHIESMEFNPFGLHIFDEQVKPNEIVGDITTEQIDIPAMVLDRDGNLVFETDLDIAPPTHTVDSEFTKFLDDFLKTSQQANIPHTAKGVRVKDDFMSNEKNVDFSPDKSIEIEWNKSRRFENGKYHDELTRSFKDKEGNTVQELQYRGTYAKRTLDSTGKTKNIHVGRNNKSDLVDHAKNQELDTALNRIFNTNNYGYLTQIPKGMDTIKKLEANPKMVITSKRTGEDLTAQQWQAKLIQEQKNIQVIAKTMTTLAKCAIKQAK